MKLILSNLGLLGILMLWGNSIQAQNVWKYNKPCVVCLTYDDATPNHLDIAIPQLDRYHLKATFYLTGSSETLCSRLSEWRKAAEAGHELGNHTLFHPCNGVSKNRAKVTPDKDLDNYSLQRFLEEVRVSNTILKAIDGKEKRSFAYTCGDRVVEGKNLEDFLPQYVAAARGTQPGYANKQGIDLFNLPAFNCAGKTAEELISIIEEGKQKNSLIVFMFHGVGGGHLSIDQNEHEKLLQYLASRETEIWVAPVIDLTDFITTGQ
jgi:peptidoglycan/xylan/chitin deacetylase (PgdA/CDA1 family)